MTDVEQIDIPGVGVRYEFETEDGKRIGVVVHRSGRKEVSAGEADDPDAYRQLLDLTEKDARTLGEVLGGSRVAESLGELKHDVEGLAIDWLPVRSDSPLSGRTIGETRVRTRTGVSIVAIIRGDEAIPAPSPDVRLVDGDYMVVVGTARGIERVVELLYDG